MFLIMGMSNGSWENTAYPFSFLFFFLKELPTLNNYVHACTVGPPETVLRSPLSNLNKSSLLNKNLSAFHDIFYFSSSF